MSAVLTGESAAAPAELQKANPLSAWTRSYVLADVISGRANNFNLIRFLAATLVIFSHCHAIAYGQNPEPVMLYFGFLETGGSLGVLVFFGLSGYLIAQSFVTRGGHLREFLLARALRLFPGMTTAALYGIVIGAFATSMPVGKYLTSHGTFRFFIRNALGYPIEFNLPGVFHHNPLPDGVNGSLWTLPLEMQMYLVCAGLGLLGLYQSREWFNSFFAAFVLLITTVKLSSLPLVADHPEAPRMAISFLFGTFFYINSRHIRVSLPWVVVVIAAIVHWHKVPDMRMMYLPAIGYIVLVLASHPKLYFAAFNRLGDYSYGLYIYAFPMQQLIAQFTQGIKAVPLFFYAYPIVLVAAVLSWHFIEKPALRWKPGGKLK